MDSLTTKHKVILGTLAFLVVIIPIISFVVSYRFRAQLNSQASNENSPTIQDLSLRPIVDNPTPEKTLLDQLKDDLKKDATASSESIQDPGAGTTLNLGPTLTFNIQKEGRAKTNQAEPKLFVGLASGQSTKNPQYLLSFTVEITAQGAPKEELSISGLTVGDTYTAYIKGQTTLTAASTFSVKPTATNLGTINLLVGDLNDDNVVDSLDRDILMKAFGTREGSEKWNPIADFNADGVINTSDLAFITKNMNKTGSSGPWSSKLPASATSSATATSSGALLPTPAQPDTGGPEFDPNNGPRDIAPIKGKGHWIWIPGI